MTVSYQGVPGTGCSGCSVVVLLRGVRPGDVRRRRHQRMQKDDPFVGRIQRQTTAQLQQPASQYFRITDQTSPRLAVRQ